MKIKCLFKKKVSKKLFLDPHIYIYKWHKKNKWKIINNILKNISIIQIAILKIKPIVHFNI